MQRTGALAACVVLAATQLGQADDKGLYERLWPRVPDHQYLSLSQQILDHLSDVTNTIGYHLDVLSHDMLTLKMDLRRRRAYVRVGGGDEQYLTFRLASDVLFTDGLARINTRIDLAFRGRKLQLELPETEILPTSYNGDRGVEVRLPLFRRRW